MSALSRFVILFLLLVSLFVVYPVQAKKVLLETPSPTPTYDPLEEPLLPENPTEYELGRNLYWHWCMTCHGDRGQGLTDAFRAIWEPDHQDCWGRGCHAGRPGDTGFPIPTVVPAIVDATHLGRFTSVQQLSDFLKATHPPQSPGILEGDEYHAIAVFVFTMNQRSLIETPATKTPAATFVPTATMVVVDSRTNSFPVYALAIFALLMIIVFALAKRTRLQ